MSLFVAGDEMFVRVRISKSLILVDDASFIPVTGAATVTTFGDYNLKIRIWHIASVASTRAAMAKAPVRLANRHSAQACVLRVQRLSVMLSGKR
jgi:hypothetical protein